MKPRSETLFHFTKSIENLKGILASGFLPKYCLEDTRWLGLKSHDFMGFPMVCFCDVPISRISEHTSFYGQYGIGMTRQWGLSNGLIPVTYAPPESPSTQAVNLLLGLELPGEEKEDSEKPNSLSVSYRLATSIKPLAGIMVVGGAQLEKDFYQESEWRYVPPGLHVLTKEKYEESKVTAEDSLAQHRLEVAPQDIRYIVVPNEHEIPTLVDFIAMTLGHHPHNSIKILTTRIFALESLASDI
jgi:hypothetical protein